VTQPGDIDVKKYIWTIVLLLVVIGTPSAYATPTYFYTFTVVDLNTGDFTGAFIQNSSIPTATIAADSGSLAFSGSTPTFTCDVFCAGGTPTAPDVAFPAPTNIFETWDGFTATIPLAFGDSAGDPYLWTNSAGVEPSASPEPATWLYAITGMCFLGFLVVKLKTA
jgi:hypothetical protein